MVGEVVAAGTVEDIMACEKSLTGCISEWQTDHSGTGAAKRADRVLLPSAVLRRTI